ncbi:Hint domain-containing protein [Shimia biformata]|uniref:Hint domain-containing protein n=1 Tax=Shimia biformata TaxID=1294299 RepID=UPI0019517A33|nr:Hint domain-containing protein [Shimia biformata]
MARISELHYSNAYAATSGVSEFLEVALGAGEDPAGFIVSFYQADGSVGIEIPLDHPAVQVSADPDNGEMVYVISADDFPILLTDPDGGGANNYEAYALTNTETSTVIDFYDIGGGTRNIVAIDGAAAGAVSENVPVLVGPNSTTTTLQWNQPNPDTLTYDSVSAGDTGLACFVVGTLIDTPDGPRPIESLKPGDLVSTLDNGPMPLRWTGRRTVDGRDIHAPVRIAEGVFGARRDHFVSPQHRILVQGWRAELLFGEPQMLVPAKALINDGSIKRVPCRLVTYVHLLFDDHQVVTGDGVASESFFPGDEGLNGLGADTQQELVSLFPELADKRTWKGETARPVAIQRTGTLLAPVCP